MSASHYEKGGPVRKYKVVVLGNSGVGKSSLMRQFCQQKFSETSSPTIGQDTFRKRTVLNDSHVELDIWDTGGQERFRTLTASFYRHVQGVLLMFDLTDKRSFDDLSTWYRDIVDNASEGVAILLVGSKADLLEKRVISNELANQFAARYNMRYFECSSKLNTCVEEPFMTLAQVIQDGKDMKARPLSSVNRVDLVTVEVYDDAKERRCPDCKV